MLDLDNKYIKKMTDIIGVKELVDLYEFLAKNAQNVYLKPGGYAELSSSSYDDKISEDMILKTFLEYQEQEGKDVTPFLYILEEKMNDVLYDAEAYTDNEVMKDIMDETNQNEDIRKSLHDLSLNGYDERDVLNMLGIYQGVEIDYESFLPDIKVNIMMATKEELNSDCSNIAYSFPYEPDNMIRIDEKAYDNMLVKLIHSQGYSVCDVIDAYYGSHASDNKFINSVIEELDNHAYTMKVLTALVKIPSNEVISTLGYLGTPDSLKETEKRTLTLGKDTMIGLYNPWNGSGSMLDIALEKPFTVSVDDIYSVQVEGARSRNLSIGYTVDETYGLVGSCWQETGSIGDEIPAEISMETDTPVDMVKAFTKHQKEDRAI